MKVSPVIGTATGAFVTRSFHAHFSEVNPLKRHEKTSDERYAELQAYYIQRDKEKQRQRAITLAGGRLLPILNPKMR